MARNSIPDVPLTLPTTRREAASILSRIGARLNRWAINEAHFDKKIAKHQKRITYLQEQKKQISHLEIEDARASADFLFAYALAGWDTLIEKGTRTIRLATGEVRQRDVPRPRVIIRGDDVDAFMREVRRRGLAKRLIRKVEKPNLEAIQDDLSLAEGLRTVEVVYDTKVEIRPNRSGEMRLEASRRDLGAWEVVKPKARKAQKD